MQDNFSSYHPLLNFYYFITVIGLGMFLVHPVYVGISFFGACSYSIVLYGFRDGIGRKLKIFLPMMILVTGINGLFNHYGVTPLFYLRSGNAVTLEALTFGVVMSAVMASMLLWFSCCTAVMTTDKFLYLFGKILPSMSMILSMCLRFVPEFAAQAEKVQEARTGIGKGIQEGAFPERIKGTINTFSILVTWGLENGVDTADNMRARGYGLPGRTSFSLFQFRRRDKMLAFYFAILSAVMLMGLINGCYDASYNPKIKLGECELWLAVFMYCVYGLFCLTPVFLELYYHKKWDKIREQLETTEKEGTRLWESWK